MFAKYSYKFSVLIGEHKVILNHFEILILAFHFSLFTLKIGLN